MAMAGDEVNYYSFKFETQNLNDNTSLALYAIDEGQGQFAIVRVSSEALPTLPVVFNDISKPKAAVVMAMDKILIKSDEILADKLPIK